MYKIVHDFVDVESQVLVGSGRATRQSQGEHYFKNILALKPAGRGHSTKFYTGRLRPEVQTLTHLYTYFSGEKLFTRETS